jgi:Fe-S cluster assembly protein SufD
VDLHYADRIYSVLAFDTTPDALGGSDALRARRARATDALAGLELPTADQEEWRYSRIGELRLADWSPVTEVPPVEPAAHDPGVAARVLLVDGHVVDVQVDEALESRGLVVRVADEDDLAALGMALPDASLPFAVLNDAWTPAPVVVRIPAGMVLDRPVLVDVRTATPGSAAFPRLFVQAGQDSEATVVEVHGGDDVPALVVPVTELVAERAARLRYLAVQQQGRQVWQIANLAASVAQDATVSVGAAALGGAYARCRLDCRLVGRGATGNLDALYFADGDQMLDFRTFQDHAAPDTTSSLLFKGAVDGRSRSVYTGLIQVRKDARGTNAFQTNRNLNLSDEAWAESVPNLEIENNDVRCSHASTVGPVDIDQRFYLESRGVPPTVAERLIIAGFFDEVLADLPDVPARAAVRAALTAKLDARAVGA